MAILFNNQDGQTEQWVKAFEEYLPSMALHVYPHTAVEEIKYAVVWNHPKGDLKRYPNLKAILNLGAGTDYLDADPDLPKVPIVRLLDPVVGINMAQYVLYWVMHFHRGYEQYRHQQMQAQWSRFQVPQMSDFRVSVLGLGLIGEYIAKYLAQSGFTSQAWNRSTKDVDNVRCFSGPEQLTDMLASTDVLVNCLPVNQQTQGMINHTLLNTLPKGRFLINVSRGGVINDADLLNALNSGQIKGAALDTFACEPLEQTSPYWLHPNVHVTPHISGATYADTSARVVADNILRMEKGEQPFPIYSHFPY